MYNTTNFSVLQSGVRVRVGNIVCLEVRGHNPKVGNPHTAADLRNFIQKTLNKVRDLAEIPAINTFTTIVDLSRFNNSCLKSRQLRP